MKAWSLLVLNVDLSVEVAEKHVLLQQNVFIELLALDSEVSWIEMQCVPCHCSKTGK